MSSNEIIDKLSKKVGIEKHFIDDNAVSQLVPVIQSYSSGLKNPKLYLVIDNSKMTRNGEYYKELVSSTINSLKYNLNVIELKNPKEGNLKAKLDTVIEVKTKLSKNSIVISVGSGTITDIAKHACFLLDESNDKTFKTPLITCQTANSVTAYTTDLAVLFKDGVKRTLQSRTPSTVICDIQAISEAPIEMTRAGFGDVCARFVSYGDWYLASVFGASFGYSEEPLKVLLEPTRKMLEFAGEIGKKTLIGTKILCENLFLSGLGMAMVHETSPLSGFEHVISHLLDMISPYYNRECALHGAQVGVGTLLSSFGYNCVLKSKNMSKLISKIKFANDKDINQLIENTFKKYDSDGKMINEIKNDYLEKVNLLKDSKNSFKNIADKWDSDIKPNLERLVFPNLDVLLKAYKTAGVPSGFQDIKPDISKEEIEFAFINSHLIRKRFTLADLLYLCGMLDKKLFKDAYEFIL